MHHCRKLKPYKAPWISQFTALLWRSWRATLQNPIIQYIKFFTYTVKQAQKQFPFLFFQKIYITRLLGCWWEFSTWTR